MEDTTEWLDLTPCWDNLEKFCAFSPKEVKAFVVMHVSAFSTLELDILHNGQNVVNLFADGSNGEVFRKTFEKTNFERLQKLISKFLRPPGYAETGTVGNPPEKPKYIPPARKKMMKALPSPTQLPPSIFHEVFMHSNKDVTPVADEKFLLSTRYNNLSEVKAALLM